MMLGTFLAIAILYKGAAPWRTGQGAVWGPESSTGSRWRPRTRSCIRGVRAGEHRHPHPAERPGGGQPPVGTVGPLVVRVPLLIAAAAGPPAAALGALRAALARSVGAPGGGGHRRGAADVRPRPGAVVRRAPGAGGDPPRRDQDLLRDGHRPTHGADDHEHRAPRVAAAQPVAVGAGPGDGWLRRSLRRRRLRDLPLLLEGPDDGNGEPRGTDLRHGGRPGRLREGAIRLLPVPPGARAVGRAGRQIRRQRRAQLRWEAVGMGAASGVVFAALVVVGSWLASVSAGLSSPMGASPQTPRS